MAGALLLLWEISLQIYHQDRWILKHQVNLTLTVPPLLCKGGMIDIMKDQFQEGHENWMVVLIDSNVVEKHCRSKVAFELAVVPFLCSVGVWMMYHNLMVFRACFQLWKKAYLVSLSYVITWFLSFWSVFHCICGERTCTLKVSISLFHHFC